MTKYVEWYKDTEEERLDLIATEGKSLTQSLEELEMFLEKHEDVIDEALSECRDGNQSISWETGCLLVFRTLAYEVINNMFDFSFLENRKDFIIKTAWEQIDSDGWLINKKNMSVSLENYEELFASIRTIKQIFKYYTELK